MTKGKPHRKSGASEQSTIAIAIKETRIKQGLTQQELANLSGVSLFFIREFEQGKKSVRLDKVQTLLDFLGLSIKVVSRSTS